MTHDRENCKDVAALLSQYLDFELPADACADIEKHLAGCAPCIDFVESLRRTVELCRRYQPGAMPEPLTESARAELMQAWQRMMATRRFISPP